MRRIIREQLPFAQEPIEHEHGRELAAMDLILGHACQALDLIQRDLTRGRDSRHGRSGMSAEQVLRVLILKQMKGFSYDELSFHLSDSRTYRSFCRIGLWEKAPSRSTLQENLKRVRAGSLEHVNRALLAYAKRAGVEKGDRVRTDTTTVESLIHHPTDSRLLGDVLRVLIRHLRKARRYGMEFSNHERRAKRRILEIVHAGGSEERTSSYRDLLKLTQSTVDRAWQVAQELDRWEGPEAPAARRLSSDLKETIGLGRRVILQTRRRIQYGESVPSSEKLVSIFETHTDILVKGGRETEYGHKVCLTTGRSSLILDCTIEMGNPPDVTLTRDVASRVRRAFGAVPRQMAFDGGFASRSSLLYLKSQGVEDVAFSKRCGLTVSELVRSTWIYKCLRRFRAGIEGVISFLKRCFGMDRCTWRGFQSFKSYVWSSVIAANVLVLARHRLNC